MEKVIKAGQVEGVSVEQLSNALRFERAKNKVLLDEVLGLEDELVNRQLAEYGDVISEESLPFWREQLLSNREQAVTALQQFAGVKAAESEEKRDEGGKLKAEGVARPRPLHNRAAVRPVVRTAAVAGGDAVAEGMAARVRNRAHELKKAEGIPFPVAFRRAEKELIGA